MDIALGTRTEETAAIYFQQANTPEIKKYLPQRAATLEEFLADFRASQAPGAASYGQTIWLDGQYVGDVWCYCIAPGEVPGAMVSYCLFQTEQRGRGAASRALELFLAEIGPRFGLERVGAFTFADNLPSIRVLEKNGFCMMEEFEEDGRLSRYYEKKL